MMAVQASTLAFLASDRVEQTVRRLLEADGIDCTNDLRSTFFGYLQSNRAVRLAIPQTPFPVLLTDLQRSEVNETLLIFQRVCGESRDSCSMVDDCDRMAHIMKSAVGTIEQYNPSVALSLSFVVNSILVVKSSRSQGGASVPDLPGIVWIRVNDSWSIVDFAESLLHEAVHQILFIEDCDASLFADCVYDHPDHPDHMVASALAPYTSPQKASRPVEKAFHSAAVAITLGEFYSHLGCAPKTTKFLNALPPTLAGLREKKRLLSAKGLEILNSIEQKHLMMFLKE